MPHILNLLPYRDGYLAQALVDSHDTTARGDVIEHEGKTYRVDGLAIGTSTTVADGRMSVDLLLTPCEPLSQPPLPSQTRH